MAQDAKDPLLDYGLTLLVFLLMLGLGATLLPHQLMTALRSPKPLIVGVLSQFVVMPHIALLLAAVFDLEPSTAVGLLIVGCTPGGSTSNLFAFWSSGDVALSIAMTCFSTLVGTILMPILLVVYTKSLMGKINAQSALYCSAELILNVSYARGDDTVINKYCWDSQIGTTSENKCQDNWNHCSLVGLANGSDSDQSAVSACLGKMQCEFEIEMDRTLLVLFLLLLLVPVAIGTYLRSRKDKQWMADVAQSVGTNSGLFVIVVALIYGAVAYPFIWKASASVWFCAFIIGFSGFLCGYQLAR
jgi:predicted Na+-dependent transporter